MTCHHCEPGCIILSVSEWGTKEKIERNKQATTKPTMHKHEVYIIASWLLNNFFFL